MLGESKGTRKVRLIARRLPVLSVMAIIVIGGMSADIPPATAGPKPAVDFAEVEILLTDKFSVEYIRTLPRAPRSELEVLDNPSRVRVELPASEVEALIGKGADITILKRYILVDGSAGGADTSAGGVTAQGDCSGTYIQGTDPFGADIPGDNSWVYCDIEISAAPYWARVGCITVSHNIYYNFREYLIVELTDENGTYEHRLYNGEEMSSGTIPQPADGIRTFNGEYVNQLWHLRAKASWGAGNIVTWSIKVHYGPPGEDNCADAPAVTEGETYGGTTDGAGGTDQSSCGLQDFRDVWYSFTPQVTHPVRMSLAGSDFDTTLAVFPSCSGTNLACDYRGDGIQPEFDVSLTGGNTYYIRIAGQQGTTGNYVLTVTNPCDLPIDLNHDCSVDFKDLRELALYWLDDEPSVNLAPPDDIIDFHDYAVLVDQWGPYNP